MKNRSLISLCLGAVAAVIYFASMANYAFPGESAHLLAMWNALDPVTTSEYPLMALFAKACGGGNLLAPISGIIGVMLVFLLVSVFVRQFSRTEYASRESENLATIAGLVAAVVFMLTSGVRTAATHLEPRLFDAVWALSAMVLILPYMKAKRIVIMYPLMLGVMTALGFCDSALFVALMPLYLFGIVAVSMKRGEKPYAALTMYSFSFLIAFFVGVNCFDVELTPFLKNSAKELSAYASVEGWFFILFFSTLPFLISIFSCRSAFKAKPTLVVWSFHGALAFVSILAIATPLSPSSLVEPAGITPVVTSAFAAIVAGYLAAFLWLNRREVAGMAIGSVYAFVVIFASFWNLFVFDGNRGAFADEVASKIIADLGERAWLVTDGTLDDHLLYVANKEGKELHLISLQRDLDTQYLDALGKIVKEKGIGGSKNEELSLSLTLGVLPFVQDWFAADPSVAKDVAIYGAPDIWFSSGLKPVPEFLFFGADETRSADWSEWKRFDALLEAPKGWGSYRSGKGLDPVDVKRLQLRRHMGLVANNRGVWLQDQKRDDEAFDMYELVLNEIDTDNVCSLFNEIEMAGQKYARALSKKSELERHIKMIVDDKDRRYVIWRLGSFYGYIRNPEMFVRLGFAWARSGRPGDALAQIRRAIDFVPTEKRATLLNMMAALYATENDQAKSRRIYESILAKNQNDHDALVGMMRLKLLDGDSDAALHYLERAVKNSPSEGRRAQLELSMVSMMKNDLDGAKAMLKKLTAEDSKDLQAWSFLAAVSMQQYDAAKDQATKDAIVKEIEMEILPEMEKHSEGAFDYYVQTTKAFLLMRQGADKRREARDAFELAARSRPGSSVTQDLVLGLDISLDDRANAERHAREALRKNRNAPLANYVMGSLAIRKGQYREAEGFLRKAADAPQPNILALNDLAEVLRRTERAGEAETYVRRALEKAPNFYILHETLGVVLMDQDRNLDEAEEEIRKALELSKNEKGGVEDVRLYASLARVQLMRGDKKAARASVRKVEAKSSELTDYEKRELEEIKKGAL